VLQLLKDPRVDAALTDNEGNTSFWWRSRYGHCEVVERLIATGRDIGVSKVGRLWGSDTQRNALQIARVRNHMKVVALLQEFKAYPTQVRHELRVKLGMLEELAAELFAITVFVCDDLLQLMPPQSTSSRTAAAIRFFNIASKLPMELQMIVCHRAVGSMKQNILQKD